MIYVFYVLGYLIVWVIFSVVLRVLDDCYRFADFDEGAPFGIGFFWPATLPIFILMAIGHGVYSLVEYLVLVTEKRIKEKENKPYEENKQNRVYRGYSD